MSTSSSSSSSTSLSSLLSPTSRRLFLLFTTSLVSLWTLPKLVTRLSPWWPRLLHVSWTCPTLPKPFTYVGWTRSMVLSLAHQCTLLAYTVLVVESMTVDLDPSDFMMDWEDDDDDEEEEEEEESGGAGNEANEAEAPEVPWYRLRDSQEAVNEVTQMYPSLVVSEDEEEEAEEG